MKFFMFWSGYDFYKNLYSLIDVDSDTSTNERDGVSCYYDSE